MPKNPDDQYSDKEAKARFEAALKGAMSAPHKPLKKAKAKAKKANRKKKLT